MTEIIYGILLCIQVLCAIIVFWSLEVAFIILMIVTFGKGLLYQYEHFINKEVKT